MPQWNAANAHELSEVYDNGIQDYEDSESTWSIEKAHEQGLLAVAKLVQTKESESEAYEEKLRDKIEDILYSNGVFTGHVAKNTATFELRDELVSLIGYFTENKDEFYSKE